MQFPLFAPIITSMLSQRNGFLQHQPPLSKAQIPAYFQKILDVKITGCNTYSATQQLSNSATQQLSNSATQQLSNSATKGKLCSDSRIAGLRKYISFFSYYFSGSNSVGLLYHIQTLFLSLQNRMGFAVAMQKCLYSKAIINKAYYRKSRQAIWFDSG